MLSYTVSFQGLFLLIHWLLVFWDLCCLSDNLSTSASSYLSSLASWRAVKLPPLAPMLGHGSLLVIMLWEDLWEEEPRNRKWIARRRDWRFIAWLASSLCFLNHWVASQADTACAFRCYRTITFPAPSSSWPTASLQTMNQCKPPSLKSLLWSVCYSDEESDGSSYGSVSTCRGSLRYSQWRELWKPLQKWVFKNMFLI